MLNIHMQILGMSSEPKLFYGINGKVYNILLCLLLVCGCYFEINTRLNNGFQSRSLRNNYVTISTTVVTFVNNIMVTLIMGLIKAGKHQNLSTKSGKYHPVVLDCYNRIYKGKNHTVATLIIVHLLYLTCIIGDITTIIQTRIPNYQYYIFDNFLRFRQSIFLIHYYYFVKNLLHKMKCLNLILKGFTFNSKHKMVLINFISTKNINAYTKCDSLLSLSYGLYEAYSEFGAILREFNDIYGWVILILFLQLFFVCLSVFNLILTLLVHDQIKFHWAVAVAIVLHTIYATVSQMFG